MATYTAIPDANLEPDKPGRSVDALALRDNPIAIAEGASGAPRIVDGALDTTATTTGRDWVLARTALATAGAVGTYAFAAIAETATAAVAFGDTVAGSTLDASGVEDENTGSATQIVCRSGSALSGTWRCMGVIDVTANDERAATVWLRIS